MDASRRVLKDGELTLALKVYSKIDLRFDVLLLLFGHFDRAPDEFESRRGGRRSGAVAGGRRTRSRRDRRALSSTVLGVCVCAHSRASSVSLRHSVRLCPNPRELVPWPLCILLHDCALLPTSMTL